MKFEQQTILLVDDNQTVRTTYKASLGDYLQEAAKQNNRSIKYTIQVAANANEARQKLSAKPDLILLDICLDPDDRSDRSGITLLEEIRRLHSELPIIMLTGYDATTDIVRCWHKKATDYIEKPSPSSEDARQAMLELAGQLYQTIVRSEPGSPARVVGNQEALLEAKIAMREGCRSIFIRGESGTGKEAVAHAIHTMNRSRKGEFIPLSLAGLPETLVELELFGYGAHSGISGSDSAGKPGLLEKANGGTLFLDEIAEMSPAVQGKLLRVLQETSDRKYRFRPLGADKEIETDVIIVSATNQDMEAFIRYDQSGQTRFRPELYERLCGNTIELLPLRDRKNDLDKLIDHFLELQRKNKRTVTSITKEARVRLHDYNWPRNIRQLKNVLDASTLRAVLNGHSKVQPDDLPNLEDDLALQAEAGASDGTKIQSPYVTLEPTYEHLNRAKALLTLAYIEQGLQKYATRRNYKDLVGKIVLGASKNGPQTVVRTLQQIANDHENIIQQVDFPTIVQNYGATLTSPSD